MDEITYKRNDRALHLPSGRTVNVWQAAKDGSWVLIYFDGVKRGKKVPGSDLRPLTNPAPEAPNVEEVARERFSLIKPLCDTCRFGTALMCPYWSASDVNRGLALVGAKAVMAKLAGSKGLSYKVITCRRYRPGSLPNLGRVHSQ